ARGLRGPRALGAARLPTFPVAGGFGMAATGRRCVLRADRRPRPQAGPGPGDGRAPPGLPSGAPLLVRLDMAASPRRHARRALDPLPAVVHRPPGRARRGQARARAAVRGGDRGSPRRGGRSPHPPPPPHRRESFPPVFGREPIGTERGGKGSAMKRFNAIVAVLALVLAACGLADDGATTTTSAEAETPTTEATTPPEATDTTTADTQVTEPEAEGPSGDPIVIGAARPLTGEFADTGVFVRDGYQAMVEYWNENEGLLGRPVELIIEDDASDPGQAVSLLEKLITVDGVDLVLGGYPGSSAAAQMAVAEQHGMVYVSMGGHMASFEQGFQYSFGAPPLMGQWWYRGFFDFLETLPEDARPTSAAMMTANNPVGAAVREGTLSDLEAAGIELVMDELYDLPLASAEPLVSQAMNSGADLFIANSFFPDGVLTI